MKRPATHYALVLLCVAWLAAHFITNRIIHNRKREVKILSSRLDSIQAVVFNYEKLVAQYDTNVTEVDTGVSLAHPHATSGPPTIHKDNTAVAVLGLDQSVVDTAVTGQPFTTAAPKANPAPLTSAPLRRNYHGEVSFQERCNGPKSYTVDVKINTNKNSIQYCTITVETKRDKSNKAGAIAIHRYKLKKGEGKQYGDTVQLSLELENYIPSTSDMVNEAKGIQRTDMLVQYLESERLANCTLTWTEECSLGRIKSYRKKILLR